ncbi:MAG TPA: HAD-IB family hydrolase [Actinomycetes bacterium]|nr:HAD-IB family hydrolase [Actinomycetes bacterium]
MTSNGSAPAVVAGEAAAAVAPSQTAEPATDLRAAAFFDIDNTVVRGASLFHLARGLAKRKFFTASDVASFAWKQAKFRVAGNEDLDDMASAIDAALSFVAGHSIDELGQLTDEIFDERIEGKLYSGTLALAEQHLASGQRVWLVSAAPIEVASVIARKLGLTGALGTVSEVVDGIYTGRLVGAPLHGPAKAEAVRALAEREGLDLALCAAYSDSANDIPMLTLVGQPVAVNPDARLRRHARALGWNIYDYRTGRKAAKIGVPTAVVTGAAAGIAVGVLTGRRRR